MAATVTFRKVLPVADSTQSTQILRGTIVLTGSYTSGGDTLNLGGKLGALSAKVPVLVFFTETPSATVTPSGYQFYYQPGTNPTNGKLRVTQSAGTEFAAGAYSASLLQANVAFEAIFQLGQ